MTPEEADDAARRAPARVGAPSGQDPRDQAGLAPAEARDSLGLREAIAGAAIGVRRYVFGMCGDWELAEDVAQEALLRAWQNRERFNGRSDIRTWIYSIARNNWLDWLRRKGRRGREEIVTEDMATTRELSPPAEASRTELVARVRQAVGELPDDQREALALRESEDLTFAQIARLLDVPAGTVKSRVRYALLKLAEKLEPYRRELEE